jgi:hypothetical protein
VVEFIDFSGRNGEVSPNDTASDKIRQVSAFCMVASSPYTSAVKIVRSKHEMHEHKMPLSIDSCVDGVQNTAGSCEQT